MIVPAIALLLAASPMTKDSRREDVVWGLVSVGDDEKVRLHGKAILGLCLGFVWNEMLNLISWKLREQPPYIHTFLFSESRIQSKNHLPIFPNPHHHVFWCYSTFFLQ